ncbi:hypothetical protein K2X85_18110, partial [bacterium]|nr:hypothetical protein [bacterium]
WEAWHRDSRPAVWEGHPIAWLMMYVGRQATGRNLHLAFPFTLVLTLTCFLAVYRVPVANPLLLFFGQFLVNQMVVGAMMPAQFYLAWVRSEYSAGRWTSLLLLPRSNRDLVWQLSWPYVLNTIISNVWVMAIGGFLLWWNDQSIISLLSLAVVLANWTAITALTTATATTTDPSLPKGRGDAFDPFRFGCLSVVLLLLVGVAVFMMFLVLDQSSFPGKYPAILEFCMGTGLVWLGHYVDSPWKQLLGLPASAALLLFVWRCFPLIVRGFGKTHGRPR